MEENPTPNKTDKAKDDELDSPNIMPDPPKTEIQCNVICQKEEKPHTPIIAIIALIVAIAAAGFSWWQVVVAKDTANRQLRAYVVPVSIALQKPIQKGIPITLKLTVNNMGQTPAYKVSQSCVFRVAQTPHNYSTAEFKKDTDRGIAIIGKEPIPFDNVSTTISDREIGDVLSKKYSLFYYAIVRYTDIFKQCHVLHVCSEYSVESNSFIAMPDCNYEE